MFVAYVALMVACVWLCLVVFVASLVLVCFGVFNCASVLGCAFDWFGKLGGFGWL